MVEFRGNMEKTHLQGSLIKSIWNSRHPLPKGNPGGRVVGAVGPQQGVYG